MELDGNWIAIEAELAGKKIPSGLLSSISLSISKDTYTARLAGATDKGKISCNPDLIPNTMDIIGLDGPNKGKTIRAIYRMVGKNLEMCLALEGGDYPEKFTSPPEKEFFLIQYRRRNES